MLSKLEDEKPLQAYPIVFLKHNFLHDLLPNLLNRKSSFHRQLEKCHIFFQKPWPVRREEDKRFSVRRAIEGEGDGGQ